MFERNSRNPNTLATPGTSAIAERLATGNHQELLKNANNSKDACLCLDASNSTDTSNNSNASNKQHLG
jgi:hypothetical protein